MDDLLNENQEKDHYEAYSLVARSHRRILLLLASCVVGDALVAPLTGAHAVRKDRFEFPCVTSCWKRYDR